MDTERPTAAHPDNPGISYRQLGMAGGLLTMLLTLASLVWAASSQGSQIEHNTSALDKLSCLPEQMARVEATQEAQARQLDRIEDATTRTHEDSR